MQKEKMALGPPLSTWTLYRKSVPGYYQQLTNKLIVKLKLFVKFVKFKRMDPTAYYGTGTTGSLPKNKFF